MYTDLDSIRKTLVNISRGKNSLDTLIEFERILDNLEIFAYKNWILGELVDGPEISRYWYKTVWMFPYSMMPDPNAGLRLTKIGARVSFKKGIFKRPVKVKGPEDWANPETKRAKMKKTEVWLVTIEMPMKYIDVDLENQDNIILKDINRINDDIASEYQESEEPTDQMPVEQPMGAEPVPGMGAPGGEIQ